MSNHSEDIIRLIDIADSMSEIRGYVGQGEYQDFSSREDIREAVVNQLVQIGGAAALLSEDFKEKYGTVDWDILIGFQYANFDQQLELDLHPIWSIVHNDLPIIMDEVLDLATQLQDQEDLSDVALNEEDLRDLKEQRREKYANTQQPDLTQDIHMEDETLDADYDKKNFGE